MLEEKTDGDRIVSEPVFIPSTSLFLNPTTASPTATAAATASSDPSRDGKVASSTISSVAAFPTTWPRYIVPADTPEVAPANTTLISLLLSPALNWPWIVSNSNASSQVLAYMPLLIADSLALGSADNVTTSSLQAYQPTTFSPENQSSMLTVWLGYIPADEVDELQAMIRSPQSAFYNQTDPVLKQLALTVDASLPLRWAIFRL